VPPGITDSRYERLQATGKDAAEVTVAAGLAKRDRTNDVLVFNTGHLYFDEEKVGTMRLVFEKTAQLLRRVWPGIIVYRSLTVGQDGCAKHEKPLTWDRIPADWWTEFHQFKAYDQMVMEAFRDVPNFHVINVSMTDLRPDGHLLKNPSFPPGVADCMHWCLPGPIDLWSTLLLSTISNFMAV